MYKYSLALHRELRKFTGHGWYANFVQAHLSSFVYGITHRMLKWCSGSGCCFIKHSVASKIFHKAVVKGMIMDQGTQHYYINIPGSSSYLKSLRNRLFGQINLRGITRRIWKLYFVLQLFNKIIKVLKKKNIRRKRISQGRQWWCWSFTKITQKWFSVISFRTKLGKNWKF